MHAGIALGLLLSKHCSLHGRWLTEVLDRSYLGTILQPEFSLYIDA